MAGLRSVLRLTKNSRTLLNLQIARPIGPLIASTKYLLQCTKPPQFIRTLATASTNSDTAAESVLDNATYDRVCTDTLDSLCDYFEILTENATQVSGGDVAYSDGVLTVNLGKEHGTYVINRQTPNKQIWLSSPTSGPKRYDFVGPKTAESGKWIYKHTGESMHELLQQEIQQIFKEQKVEFVDLSYGS